MVVPEEDDHFGMMGAVGIWQVGFDCSYIWVAPSVFLDQPRSIDEDNGHKDKGPKRRLPYINSDAVFDIPFHS